MSTQGAGPAHRTPDSDLVARHDGAERIPLLPAAQFITFAPSAITEDPVGVTIEWGPGQVERPLPGSALWRAVLEGRLMKPVANGPDDRLIRLQIRRSLERFPDLERSWGWVRTGWLAPPQPPPSPTPWLDFLAILRLGGS